MWTVADLRDLRRWRIRADTPEPLPRFQVEPAEIAGEYQVIDRLTKYRAVFILPAQWDDPRARAQEIADELNAKYAKETEDDSA